MVQEGYHGLDWQRRNYPLLDLKTANRILRKGELTQFIKPQAAVSVTRFDTLRVEATQPCQDNYTYEVVDVGSASPWHFWGVFDGHA